MAVDKIQVNEILGVYDAVLPSSVTIATNASRTTIFESKIIDREPGADFLVSWGLSLYCGSNWAYSWGGLYQYLDYTENPDDANPTWVNAAGGGHSGPTMNMGAYGPRQGNVQGTARVLGLSGDKIQFRLQGQCFGPAVSVNTNGLTPGVDGEYNLYSKMIMQQVK